MGVDHIVGFDIVFRGEVVAKKLIRDTAKVSSSFVRRDNKPLVFVSTVYTFKIKEKIKGLSRLKYVDIHSSSMCGAYFLEEEEYYVYGYQNNGKKGYSSSSCSGNIKKSTVGKHYKKIIRQYKRSRKNQKWKNINDQIIAEGKVQKRRPVGDWVIYHPDGNIKKKGSYVKGKKHGVWKYYYNKKSSLYHYPQLLEHQKKKVKNKSNLLDRTEEYDHGKIVDGSNYPRGGWRRKIQE